MSSYWYTFWQSYRNITINSDKDLLVQTGRTIKGKPINEQHIQAIIKSIIQNLDLNSKEHLLDLCCGNGFFTYLLKNEVNKITAVDFSQQFIHNAQAFKSANNISYYCSDVLEFENYPFDKDISKIYIGNSFQYFTIYEIIELLLKCKEADNENIKVLFTDVLFSPLKWNFYNTLNRKIAYIQSIIFDSLNKKMGHWWQINEFRKIENATGFNYRIFRQSDEIVTNHYQIDVLFEYKKY